METSKQGKETNKKKTKKTKPKVQRSMLDSTLKKKKKDLWWLKGTGCCLFIYKWRGHKDIHTYKQHILLALRVQLSEQLLRHCIQQHHLPVRWISSLLLSSQKWHTWTWWHQNSYKEYSETFGLLLANVLEQYERKKKNVMWFAVHSRLFSLLKVIWIKGICAFFYSFLATSIHSGVGSCLKECTQSQSSTLIYDLIDKVSMGEVYNQFCTNFIFPSAVYGTLQHDKRQNHMFQVSIHLSQTSH